MIQSTNIESQFYKDLNDIVSSAGDVSGACINTIACENLLELPKYKTISTNIEYYRINHCEFSSKANPFKLHKIVIEKGKIISIKNQQVSKEDTNKLFK